MSSVTIGKIYDVREKFFKSTDSKGRTIPSLFKFMLHEVIMQIIKHLEINVKEGKESIKNKESCDEEISRLYSYINEHMCKECTMKHSQQYERRQNSKVPAVPANILNINGNQLLDSIPEQTKHIDSDIKVEHLLYAEQYHNMTTDFEQYKMNSFSNMDDINYEPKQDNEFSINLKNFDNVERHIKSVGIKKPCSRVVSRVAELGFNQDIGKEVHGIECKSDESHTLMNDENHAPLGYDVEDLEIADIIKVEDESFILPDDNENFCNDAIKEEPKSHSGCNNNIYFNNEHEYTTFNTVSEKRIQVQGIIKDSCLVKNKNINYPFSRKIITYPISSSVEEVQENDGLLQESQSSDKTDNQCIQSKNGSDQIMILEIKFETESEDQNHESLQEECYDVGQNNQNLTASANENISRISQSPPYETKNNQSFKRKWEEYDDRRHKKETQYSILTNQSNSKTLKSSDFVQYSREIINQLSLQNFDFDDKREDRKCTVNQSLDHNNPKQIEHDYESCNENVDARNTLNNSDLQIGSLENNAEVSRFINKGSNLLQTQKKSENHDKYIPFLHKINSSHISFYPQGLIKCPFCETNLIYKYLKNHLNKKHYDFLMFRAKQEGIDHTEDALQYTVIDILHKDFCLAESLIRNFNETYPQSGLQEEHYSNAEVSRVTTNASKSLQIKDSIYHIKYLPFLRKISFKFRTVRIRDPIGCPICGMIISRTCELKLHLIKMHSNFLKFRAKYEGIHPAMDAAQYTYIDIVHKDFSLSKSLIRNFNEINPQSLQAEHQSVVQNSKKISKDISNKTQHYHSSKRKGAESDERKHKKETQCSILSNQSNSKIQKSSVFVQNTQEILSQLSPLKTVHDKKSVEGNCAVNQSPYHNNHKQNEHDYASCLECIDARNTVNDIDLQLKSLENNLNFDVNVSSATTKASNFLQPQPNFLNHKKYLPHIKKIDSKYLTVGYRNPINCQICGYRLSRTDILKKHLITKHYNFLKFRIKHEGINSTMNSKHEGMYSITDALDYTYIDIVHKDFCLSESLISNFNETNLEIESPQA